jgi:hypothetical protein
LFQASVQVPVNDLLAVDLFHGRAVFLSDLKPKNYTHTPFFGMSWPLVSDGSVNGAALQLGEDYFDKGLGMHSGSQVIYGLGGKYEWFESLVGVAGGARGKATFRVLVDGKPQDMGDKKEWTGNDPPVFVRVPVRNAKLLTLEAGYGSGGNVQGHVNWVNARLIKD